MSSRKTSFKKKAKEKYSTNQYQTVSVYLLDNNVSPLKINLQDDMNGIALLDEVCDLLGGILEKDYFGLRYLCKNQVNKWLDGNRSVFQQIKKAKTTSLSFRVKHYPKNPVDDLCQDIVRYFFYLQLRRDLLSGNLLVKGEMLIKLISLVLQAEHGDVEDVGEANILLLLTNLNVVENFNNKVVEEVAKFVVTLNGLDSKEAERQFLDLVYQLESYGVEPYQVLSQSGEKLFLTMNHHGICTFLGERRKNIFYWENITKLMFIKKQFLVEANIENKKRRYQFQMNSKHVAKEFWKWALDRQSFMTLNNAAEAKKVRANNVIFGRKVTHKFCGKSLKELTASCQSLNTIPQPPIVRMQGSNMTRCNSFKATCRHSVNFEGDGHGLDLYATMPRVSKANKELSMELMDFENDQNVKSESVTSATSDESVLLMHQHSENGGTESELQVIVEDNISEAAVESEESTVLQSLYCSIDQTILDSDNENAVRERRLSTDRDHSMKSSSNGPITAEQHPIGDNNINVDNYRLRNVDGMFFIKFVILTTLILLVIMVTSLIGYYYYRSSAIADLNKQKYSSEWNKNIDLESIKRFVLRNDAP